jgi:hypothetical protein
MPGPWGNPPLFHNKLTVHISRLIRPGIHIHMCDY